LGGGGGIQSQKPNPKKIRGGEATHDSSTNLTSSNNRKNIGSSSNNNNHLNININNSNSSNINSNSNNNDSNNGNNSNNNNNNNNQTVNSNSNSNSTNLSIQNQSGINDQEGAENGNFCYQNSSNGIQPKPVTQMLNNDPNDSYSLFFVNNNWYLFFRLHHILCDRLSQMYNRAANLITEEEKEKSLRKESTAVALRLKPESKLNLPVLSCY